VIPLWEPHLKDLAKGQRGAEGDQRGAEGEQMVKRENG